MSVNGKVLLSKNTEGSVTEAIDISNYEKGIYIVQAYSGKQNIYNEIDN